MAWGAEPKTDWISTDAVSYEHYNRIRGNILFLHGLAKELYPDFDIKEMGSDKDAGALYTADEWNKFEDNIEKINQSVYTLKIGTKKTFFPNGAFIRFDELNRLEKACILLQQTLTGQKESKKRLAFTLGGSPKV